MGPFAYLPMQCNHDVLSIGHEIKGKAEYQGKEYDFSGIGYIEKDWGEAFPQSWVWLQANDKETSFMCSIATIPFIGLKFKGVIAYLHHNGTEYRFATYNRGKVQFIKRTDDGLSIGLEKNKQYLVISAVTDKPNKLFAPTAKGMDREIFESLNTEITVELFYDGKSMFRKTIYNGGMEMSEIKNLIN